MKNSTQLFSTVSLLVLLSTTPANLWAMTNEGTEEKSSTTTAVKTPDVKEDKKEETPPVTQTTAPAKGWSWPFSWGSTEAPQDDKKDAAPAVTQAKIDDAVKGAEDLKGATLTVIGMTREDFEKAEVEALRVKLETEGLSDEQYDFLETAINTREQSADLLLTASQLVQASKEQLQELQKDPELSPEMQKLASSALGSKQQGGTEEEQAARVVKDAQASSEWGWSSTVAYYTLGAPVTIPYEFYKWAFRGNPSADPIIPVVNALPEKDNAPLPQDLEKVTSGEPVVQVAAMEGTPVQNSTDPVTPVAEEQRDEPKKLSRAERRAAAKDAKKQRAAEQRKAAEAQRAANLAKLRGKLKK